MIPPSKSESEIRNLSDADPEMKSLSLSCGALLPDEDEAWAAGVADCWPWSALKELRVSPIESTMSKMEGSLLLALAIQMPLMMKPRMIIKTK